MTHIINKKLNNNNKTNIYSYNNKDLYTGNIKYYNPSINEWHNSIYSYDNNKLTNVLVKDKYLSHIINSYFNSKPINSNKRIIKFSWLKFNKIFIGKSEIKHYTNKVLITIYTFNRENMYLLSKIKNTKYITFSIKNFIKYKNIEFKLKSMKKKLKNIFSIKLIKVRQNIILNSKYNNYISFFNYLPNALKSVNLNNNNIILNKNSFLLYIITNMLNNNMSKIYYYKFYIALLYINSIKFSSKYLLGVKYIISKIYNKKIELNIVKLKYSYMENNIFTNILVKKIKHRKGKILKIIKHSLKKIKKGSLDPILKLPIMKKINKLNDINTNEIVHNNLIYNNKLNNYKIVLKDLKNKHIIGIKLQGKGRLTKRLTASRSVLKYKYAGTLKNIYSSYQKLSVIMLKGYAKSNIQYTNINSSKRTGSFSMKSWINSF